MADSSTGKLVAAFVLLIIGIVLASQVATMGQEITEKSKAADESHVIGATVSTGRNITHINETITYTLDNAPTGWKAEDCAITGFNLKNSSGSELTETTDYTVDLDAGTWVFVMNGALNNSIDFTTNQTLADYQYCGDDYMNLSWGRTGIDLVPGFFAIALLLISVGLFYSIARENGIIN